MKVIFSKSGKGSISPKINLKNTGLSKLGITPEEPEVDVTYTKSFIIIRKKIDVGNKIDKIYFEEY